MALVEDASISNNRVKGNCDPLNFKCTFAGCSRAYNRQWKLSRHSCTHTKERPFLCPITGCDKSYQCKQHLDRHVKTFHEREKYCLPCPNSGCLITFSTKSALMKHLAGHEKKRKYKCSVCDVSFLTEVRLTQHENAHKGILPFTCEVCKSQWAKRTLLRRHMRSHSMRPCPQKDCSFVTQTFQLLRRHMKVAHFIAYECATCGKKIGNKSILKEHVTRHFPPEDRTVLRCPFIECTRQYFHLKNLQHHLKVFHKQQRFYCDVNDCKSSYFSEVKLAAHKKRNHKIHSPKKKTDLIEKITERTTVANYDDDDDDTTIDDDSETIDDYPGHYLMLIMNTDHT